MRFEAESQVVENGQVRKKSGRLEDQGGIAFPRRKLRRVPTSDENLSLRRRFQAGDQTQKRAFSRTRRSQNRQKFSLFDDQIDSVDRPDSPRESFRSASAFQKFQGKQPFPKKTTIRLDRRRRCRSLAERSLSRWLCPRSIFVQRPATSQSFGFGKNARRQARSRGSSIRSGRDRGVAETAVDRPGAFAGRH